MNRIFFSLTAVVVGLLLLILDSALKGAALLVVAAIFVLALGWASAATRHLVWVVAVVALLIVPVLSAVLPQWRVLPRWAPDPLRMAAVERPVEAPPEVPRVETPVQPEPPRPVPEAEITASLAAPIAPIEAAFPVRNWFDWLPFAWIAGFSLLSLRLLAAHLFLWVGTRGCRILAPSESDRHEMISACFSSACDEIGVRKRVLLLLDQRRTIPVVWGIFRPRLLLPAEALDWNPDQLRSVLLHALAHLRRRDPLVQRMTQIACALHWWNPLVWIAAWRLHVERERACDDLVLASGVSPSSYAGHLLDIAAKLSPAPWTQTCGLAMARKSSLESRLLAVLSKKLNRRRVTGKVAAAALLCGTAIAIPLAMVRAADDKEEIPRPTATMNEIPQHEADPDAGKRSRIANGPGRYLLDGNTHMQVTQTNGGGKRTNRASIIFLHPNPEAILPPKPYEIALPDGNLTYAIAWERGAGVLWILQKGLVRSYDFQIQTQVTETRSEPGSIVDVPEQFRDALKGVFNVPGAPKQKPMKPDGDAKFDPGTLESLTWGGTVNGLRAALAIRTSPEEPGASETPDLYLVLQNVSDAPIHLNDTVAGPGLRSLAIHRDELLQSRYVIDEPTLTDMQLQPREAVSLLMTPRGDAPSKGQMLAANMLKEPHLILVGQLNIDVAPSGAWTGKLTTGKTGGAAAAGQSQPKRAGKSGKVDWSKFPHNSWLSIPFDPEVVIRLAAAPDESDDGIRRLMPLILQGAVEKATELRPLLQNEALKRIDDEEHSLALALAFQY